MTLTKTAQRAVNSRIRTLRADRRDWVTGKAIRDWWGIPWCTGPASPYHQEICCEGCATVAWCRGRAEEIAGEIGQLEASLMPAVQEALW